MRDPKEYASHPSGQDLYELVAMGHSMVGLGPRLMIPWSDLPDDARARWERNAVERAVKVAAGR